MMPANKAEPMSTETTIDVTDCKSIKKPILLIIIGVVGLFLIATTVFFYIKWRNLSYEHTQQTNELKSIKAQLATEKANYYRSLQNIHNEEVDDQEKEYWYEAYQNCNKKTSEHLEEITSKYFDIMATGDGYRYGYDVLKSNYYFDGSFHFYIVNGGKNASGYLLLVLEHKDSKLASDIVNEIDKEGQEKHFLSQRLSYGADLIVDQTGNTANCQTLQQLSDQGVSDFLIKQFLLQSSDKINSALADNDWSGFGEFADEHKNSYQTAKEQVNELLSCF